MGGPALVAEVLCLLGCLRNKQTMGGGVAQLGPRVGVYSTSVLHKDVLCIVSLFI
jgi:hypothetical protein